MCLFTPSLSPLEKQNHRQVQDVILIIISLTLSDPLSGKPFEAADINLSNTITIEVCRGSFIYIF